MLDKLVRWFDILYGSYVIGIGVSLSATHDGLVWLMGTMMVPVGITILLFTDRK